MFMSNDIFFCTLLSLQMHVFPLCNLYREKYEIRYSEIILNAINYLKIIFQ